MDGLCCVNDDDDDDDDDGCGGGCGGGDGDVRRCSCKVSLSRPILTKVEMCRKISQTSVRW